jgi:hypothetical protein
MPSEKNRVEVMLTPGQDHDLTCAEPLIEAEYLERYERRAASRRKFAIRDFHAQIESSASAGDDRSTSVGGCMDPKSTVVMERAGPPGSCCK